MKLDCMVNVDNLDMCERLKEFGSITSKCSIAGQHMIFMTVEHSEMTKIIELNGVLKITEEGTEYVLLKN